MSRIQRWWREPDHFDWTTEFLKQRGLLRSARKVMAIVAFSAAMVPISFLGGAKNSGSPLDDLIAAADAAMYAAKRHGGNQVRHA